MMRSMYAAVGGLRAHQSRMDVIGNNIANVNTTAFKSSRVTFEDVYYQTLSSGSGASATLGGVNPRQVGVGMSLSTIDTVQTQGNVQPTGLATDLMIQGDGFFVLCNGDQSETYYTRAGVLGWDEEGYLVHKGTGLYVQSVDGDRIQIDTDCQSFGIDRSGFVTYVAADGTASGGDTAHQIAIAKFSNPEGLLKEGSNLYRYDVNAGEEADGDGSFDGGIPGENGRGVLVGSSLEMSNVDLAQELTDMITTQRGYQANARIITVSDQMLEELVNIKR